MTPQKARAELQRPLVFGNPEQIRAIEVLESIEQCVTAILGCAHAHSQHAKCQNCNGSGECRCFDCDKHHDCGKCDGSGKSDVRCSCYADFPAEILDAALDDHRISRELREIIEELPRP